MTQKGEIQKVSMLSRILAWILILFGAFALFGLGADVYRHRGWPWGVGESLLTIFILLIYFLFSFYVAFKGGSPRWLSSIENTFDQEIGRRGDRTAATNSTRIVMYCCASLVFGLFLLYLGNALDLFAGENRWFAMAVFVIVWLSIDVFVWRYFKRSRAGGDNGA